MGACRLLLMFAACIVGGSLLTSQAPAQPGAEPSRYEYLAIGTPTTAATVTKRFNELAAEGWDYVGPLGNGLAIFKRVRLTPQEAAGQKELAKWQGEWKGDEGEQMAFAGNRWISSSPTFGPVSGTLRIVEVGEKFTHVDLIVEDGPTKGMTVKAILKVAGEALQYCGTYGGNRPTEFQNEEGYYACVVKRVKK